MSHVYLYEKTVREDELVLQKEEVESVKWMSLSECYQVTREKNPLYILAEEELDMIKKYMEENI